MADDFSGLLDKQLLEETTLGRTTPVTGATIAGDPVVTELDISWLTSDDWSVQLDSDHRLGTSKEGMMD